MNVNLERAKQIADQYREQLKGQKIEASLDALITDVVAKPIHCNASAFNAEYLRTKDNDKAILASAPTSEEYDVRVVSAGGGMLLLLDYGLEKYLDRNGMEKDW